MQKISDLIQEDVEHFLYAGDQWISGVDFAKLSDQFSILLEQSKATEGETVIITDVGYAKMLASAMVLLEKGINVLVAGSDFCQEKYPSPNSSGNTVMMAIQLRQTNAKIRHV